MDFLTFAYTASGILFGTAFIPQIVTLLKDRSGAAAINLSTWFMFTVCSIIGVFYAFMHNGDTYFILCSAIGAMGNISVFAIASARRMRQFSYVRAKA